MIKNCGQLIVEYDWFHWLAYGNVLLRVLTGDDHRTCLATVEIRPIAAVSDTTTTNGTGKRK